MARLRMGVLGGAKIAVDHVIPAMQATSSVECAAIASTRPEVAAALATKLGIPHAFSSYEALLRSPEVDAVYIPLGNGDHRAWVERAAAAGKHILCEKPLGISAAEAAAMFAIAESHGVRLMEAYSYYFSPQHRHVQDLIQQGMIGEPSFFRCTFTGILPARDEQGRLNTRYDPKAGGTGALMDIGCYGIHTARRMYGADPIAVTAHSTLTADGVDVATSGILEFPDHRIATVTVAFNLYPCHEYEVRGAKGSIRAPLGYGIHAPGTAWPIAVATAGGTRTDLISYEDPIGSMLEHFAALVWDPQLAPFTPKSETLGILRTIDAWIASAKSGQRVAL